MITSIDTNILLDIFLPDETYVQESTQLLKSAYNDGALVICNIVYAELAPQFTDQKQLDDALHQINVETSSIDRMVAFEAGERWKLCRESGGKRKRIITDFLIGAHALLKADRFLTRDRGFYKSYFSELNIMS